MFYFFHIYFKYIIIPYIIFLHSFHVHNFLSTLFDKANKQIRQKRRALKELFCFYSVCSAPYISRQLLNSHSMSTLIWKLLKWKLEIPTAWGLKLVNFVIVRKCNKIFENSFPKNGIIEFWSKSVFTDSKYSSNEN